jgi:hypothetical protein
MGTYKGFRDKSFQCCYSTKISLSGDKNEKNYKITLNLNVYFK